MHSTFRVAMICKIVSMVALVCICGSPQASAALVRPTEVNFAFVSDVFDDTTAVQTLERYLGLQAAMKVINDNDIMNGVLFNFTAVQGALVESPSAAYYTSLSANLTSLNPFGFVLPDWRVNDVAAAVATSSAETMPMVSPSTVSSGVYNSTYRHWIFPHQPFAAEYLGQLNYALNGQSRCAYSVAIGQEFAGIAELLNSTAKTLTNLGLSATTFILTDAEMLTNATAVIRERFFANAPKVPGCVFITSLKDVLQTVIDSLWGDPRFDRDNTFFFGPSAAASLFYNSSTYGTEAYGNLRFAYPAHDPSNISIPSVQRFQSALNDIITLQQVPQWLINKLNPARVLEIVALGFYTPAGYDAFLTALFIAEVIRGMPSVTRTAFIDRVYEQKYFNVNETFFGPFSDGCATGSPTTFPCFCNTGGRTYYMYQVNLTNGKLGAAQQDDALQDGDLLSQTTSLSACTLKESDIQNPLNFAFVVDQAVLNLGDDQVNAMRSYILTLVNAASYANTDGGVAQFGRLNPLMLTADLSTADPDAVLYNLTVRYNPYALIGGSIASKSSGIPSLFENALQMDVADLPLTQATTHSHYNLALTPVLADYIHTMANLLFSSSSDSTGLKLSVGTPVHVLYSGSSTTVAEQILSLVVRSLNTYQSNAIYATDISSMTTAEITAQVSSVVGAAATGSATVMFVATLNDTTVTTVLTALATQTTSTLLTTAQRTALTVVLAVPELGVFAAKTSLASASLTFPTGTHVFFPTLLAAWWVPTSTMYNLLQQFSGSGASFVNTPLDHPARVFGVLSAIFLYTSTRSINSASVANAAALISAIYSTRTISAYGVSYGPLYSTNCSADIISSQTVDRTCQCYKGARTFYTSTVNDWLAVTSGTMSGFQYDMSTCGVKYSPLIVASSLSAGAIAGIAVGASGGFLILCGAFWCCYNRGKRDNRSAPKDPTKPFAMMFTDIQSSTSLWARAPEQMGPSVDQHHALIRSLIGKHNGYEVKTIGDSFMVAFHHGHDAVNLAVELQDVFYRADWPVEIDRTYQALAQESVEDMIQDGKPPPSTMQSYWRDDETYKKHWNGVRVRVGLHWGHGSIKLDQVSQGYDYYGTVVNTAARVEGIGNGGQVLITKDMYDELERAQFDFGGVELSSLGPQPLRGLDAPTPLYQLNPRILGTRTFNTLRLDVENAIEDESESTATAESISQTGDGNATAEAIISRMVTNKRVPTGFRENVLFCAQFLEVAMSTSTAKWRKETAGHLMHKWHVHVRKQYPTETDEHYVVVRQLALVVKLMLALEDVRKAAANAAGGVGGGGTSDGQRSFAQRGSFQQSFPNTPMVVIRTPPSSAKIQQQAQADFTSYPSSPAKMMVTSVTSKLSLDAPGDPPPASSHPSDVPSFESTEKPDNELQN
ncbi:receptor-type adenylate cyclase, putative [Bodo saltans]|uniref:adenylate cyclase n=1 Tax=Bodo saltans TaxID=75058 RepID=A0A0S4J3N6_BODSA|nr:receptor-type adenylate cyclase, putative [Bodo saltans]|eukprot:CUG34590.1 receptor-type adenylate cyclase, putative [Bodo saltans]